MDELNEIKDKFDEITLNDITGETKEKINELIKFNIDFTNLEKNTIEV